MCWRVSCCAYLTTACLCPLQPSRSTLLISLRTALLYPSLLQCPRPILIPTPTPCLPQLLLPREWIVPPSYCLSLLPLLPPAILPLPPPSSSPHSLPRRPLSIPTPTRTPLTHSPTPMPTPFPSSPWLLRTRCPWLLIPTRTPCCTTPRLSASRPRSTTVLVEGAA